MENKIKALVVLSGGQDSTTCLALAVKAYGPEAVRAITFDYGQRHHIEIQASLDVAFLVGIPAPEIIVLGPQIMQSTSPLTDPNAKLELYDDHDSMEAIIGARVEKTFVPMRNALFLTVAANRAVVMGASEIWTGVCQADNANYPDCRYQFIYQQEVAINEALGTLDESPGYEPISIVTPLMNLSKDQSIKMLLEQGPAMYALLGHSHTAYDGGFPPVSKDHASVLRAHGFEQAKVPDPLVVRAWWLGLMDLPETPNYSDQTLLAAVRESVQSNEYKLGQKDQKAFDAMGADHVES